MRKNYRAIGSRISLFIGILLSVNVAIAQEDVTQFLKAGVNDANTLIESYISPFGNAFGATMNSGWFNTAKAHKPAGFDLTITLNGIMIPEKFQSYDFNTLDLEKLTLKLLPQDPGFITSLGSTLFGDTALGPEVDVKTPNPLFGINPGSAQDTVLVSFPLPPGLGMPYFAFPNVQLRVGIYKNTDIMFRYIPKIAIPGGGISGEVGLYGIGLMHDFKQWIPGFKDLPFDMAIQGAYSKFEFSLGFPQALKPDPSAVYDSTGAVPDVTSYNDQGFIYDISAWNINVLISKKLSVITFYGALGWNQSTGRIALEGKYPIPSGFVTAPSSPVVGAMTVEDIQNPIDFTMKNGSPRFTAGFRLKLLILTIHADYTFANYPVATAGIGFSIR